jgi:hypothetical protein
VIPAQPFHYPCVLLRDNLDGLDNEHDRKDKENQGQTA